MDNLRYIGLDVHRDTVSVAVLNREGQLLMQSVVPTRAPALLDLLDGIRGTLHEVPFVARFQEPGFARVADQHASHSSQQQIVEPCRMNSFFEGDKADDPQPRSFAACYSRITIHI